MRELFRFSQSGYSYVKQFLLSLIDTYWTRIDINIKSALIGAFAALFVAYLQDWQERRREGEKQTSTEQNKLKYLYFLMQDTDRSIKVYNRSVNNMKKSVEANLFMIPDLPTYNPHSLNAIANKLGNGKIAADGLP